METTYEQLIREVVSIDKLYVLSNENLWSILLQSKPIYFNGHFELLSGLHTDAFFRFAHIAQYPHCSSEIAREMSGWVKNAALGKIDVVLGTSRAGMVLAHDLARELRRSGMAARAVYAKSDPENGYPIAQLLEGFSIDKGERVLVVNDLTTTGRSLQTLIDLVESYRGVVVGVCVVASREEALPLVSHYKFHSIMKLRTKSWGGKKVCPRCRDGKPLVYSRDINSLTLETPIKEILSPLKELRVA
jgi:orotate phosphoribosyltransferase